MNCSSEIIISYHNPLGMQVGLLAQTVYYLRSVGKKKLRDLIDLLLGYIGNSPMPRTSLLRIWLFFFSQAPYKIHTIDNDTECSLGPVKPLSREEPTSRVCNGERVSYWFLRDSRFLQVDEFLCGSFQVFGNSCESLNPWETEKGYCQ